MSWIKGSTSQGKYPEKAFSGIVTAMYPAVVGKKETPALRLDFDSGEQLAIFGIDKIDENGVAPGFMGIGKFLDSLTALKIEYQWGIENNEVMGFQTVPDITGCRLYMKPELSKGKTVSDAGETPEEYKNWIVEKIEKVTTNNVQGTTTTTTTAPKRGPGKLPSTVTKEPEPQLGNLKGAWEDALKNLLMDKEPLSEKDCQLQLKTVVTDAKVRKAMSDYRAQNNLFKTFKDEGFLVEENGKYQVAV